MEQFTFDKKNAQQEKLFFSTVIQFSLIGLLIAQKPSFDKNKSGFSVEDVINSVESFHENLSPRGESLGVFSDTECEAQLRLFAEALDERDDWAIHSKSFVSWFIDVSIFTSLSIRCLG